MINVAILLLFASVSDADVTSVANSLLSVWNASLAEKQSKLEAFDRVFVDPSVDKPTFFNDAKKRPSVKVKVRKDADSLKKELRESISAIKKQINTPSDWPMPRRPFFELTIGMVCEIHTTAGDRLVRGSGGSAQAGSVAAYDLLRQRDEANSSIPFDVIGCVSAPDGSYRGSYGKYVIRFTTDDQAGGGNYRISGPVRVEAISGTEFRLHVFSEAERKELIDRVNEKLIKNEKK